MRGGPTTAAIVCGTNSIRLLVADADGIAVQREVRVTRLGEGVGSTGRLGKAAIDRTVAVLRDYRGIIEGLGVERIRMAATSAARDAENRAAFAASAERVVGVPLELLSGDEEARLSFRAATAALGGSRGRLLVADIGGGSTELAVGPIAGRPGEPENVRSLDVGCVNLTESFLRGDPPSAEQLSRALSAVEGDLRDVVRECPTMAEASGMVLLAGAAAQIGAVRGRASVLEAGGSDHPALTRAAVEDLLRSRTSKSRHAGGTALDVSLADVVVGGAAILLGIMRRLDFETCLISAADILDGLLLSGLETGHPTEARPTRGAAPPLSGSRGGGQAGPAPPAIDRSVAKARSPRRVNASAARRPPAPLA